MTTPTIDPAELAAAPEILLGRRTFKILELVPTQNEIVTPAIFELFELFVRAKMAAESKSLVGMKLTKEQYRLLLDVCAVAISRAEPGFKRQDLDQLPIKTLELFAAFVVIAKQAGVVPEEVTQPVLPPDGKAQASSASGQTATSEAARADQPTGPLSPSRLPSALAGTSIESEPPSRPLDLS